MEVLAFFARDGSLKQAAIFERQFHIVQIHVLQIQSSVMFYKSSRVHILQIHVLQIHVLQIQSSPCFTNPIRVLQIQSSLSFTICRGDSDEAFLTK